MAKIPLRKYVNEIERLIEISRNEEAIAHCRHILQSYPRCIDVYRMLGKAYLETQRYGDAADLLQRVLSSIPEDYIAHVGMSIIREDEGNLDEAIWHMERAFENQPSNGAIQDELRRLFGRRDGAEPPKIHLTRGALARMYVKGDLQQQAIAELRAALAEDPKRIDLQLLLSTVLYETGQRAEAAELAASILRKLPNCLEANRVMAEVLSESERLEEAQMYRKRLISLDPYYEHVSPSTPQSGQVPEELISLDKLDWKPGQAPSAMPSQPAWATTLGVSLGDERSEKEELPDWLTGVKDDGDQDETPSQAPFTEESDETTPIPTSQEKDQFSAFLSDLEDKDQSSASLSDLEETPPSPSTKDQIPDWMSDAGWSPSTGDSEEIGGMDDLGETKSEPDMDEVGLEKADIPEWVQAMAPLEIIVQAESPDDETSPGLEDLLSPEEIAGIPPSPETRLESEPQEELPEWLMDDIPSPTAPEGEEPSSELPERLHETADEAAADLPVDEELPLKDDERYEELPDWLKEEETQEGVSDETEFTAEAEPAQDGDSGVWLPPWLQEHASTSAPSESQESAAGEEFKPEEEIPAWLLEEEPSDVDQVIPDSEPSQDTEEFEKLPDWKIEGEPITDQPVSPEKEEDEEVEAFGDIPEWLMDEEPLSARYAMPEPVEPAQVDEQREDLPPWLIEEHEPVIETDSKTVEPVSEDKQPTADDLAVESSTEELPDWLLEEVTEVEPETQQPELELEEEEAAVVEPRESESLPSWLKALEQEVEIVEEDTQPRRVAAIEEEVPAVDQTAELTIEDEELVLDQVAETPQETLPEPVEEQPSIEKLPTDKTAPIEDEAAFAWLESLAVKQGAEEALLLTPEERLETPPDWVQEEIKASEEAAVQPPEDLLPEEDLIVAEKDITLEMVDESLDRVEAEDISSFSEEGVGYTEPIPEELEPEIFAVGEALEEKEIPEGLFEEEILPEGIVAEELPEKEVTAKEEFPDEAELEELPELPEWLAESAIESKEELEWQPPPVIDLNQASLSDLERLTGIGFIIAQNILEYREKNGPFSKLEDLLLVPGFTPDLLEEISDRVFVEAPEEPFAAPEEMLVPIHLEEDAPEELIAAHQALENGNIDQALLHYSDLIRISQSLSRVIQDLHTAAERYENRFEVWQSLGDAYMKDNQVQKALDAYLKAEKAFLP